jgi:ABC-type glycerol-3-phosphate transport system permease component
VQASVAAHPQQSQTDGSVLKRVVKAGPIVAYAALVLWALAAMLPVFATIVGSLKNTTQITASPLGIPHPFEWGNFASAWRGPLFGEPLRHYALNSAIAVGIGVAAGVASGTLAGYALARKPGQLRLLNRYFVVLLTIPAIVTWVPLYSLASSLGVVNSAAGLGLIYAAFITPLVTVLMRTYFSSFPLDLIEAARVDGASEIYTFTRIVLPMSRGVIAVVALIQAIWLWNELALAEILLLEGSNQTLPVGLIQFKVLYLDSHLGPQFAGLVLAIIPLVLLYIVTGRRITEGMRLGALR